MGAMFWIFSKTENPQSEYKGFIPQKASCTKFSTGKTKNATCRPNEEMERR